MFPWITHGRYDFPRDIFFPLPSCSYLRGASAFFPFIWFVEKRFFSVRIVVPWNKLPHFVINWPSITIFKNRVDAFSETIFGSNEPHFLFCTFPLHDECHLCIYDQYILTLINLSLGGKKTFNEFGNVEVNLFRKHHKFGHLIKYFENSNLCAK